VAFDGLFNDSGVACAGYSLTGTLGASVSGSAGAESAAGSSVVVPVGI
jgi:hypothetical protein